MDETIARLLEPDAFLMGRARLLTHYHLLSQVLAYGVPGDVVELGCFQGTSAALLAAVLSWADAKRTLHLYDSFEGLPALSVHDVGSHPWFRKGLFETSPEGLKKALGPHNVISVIHPGWFADIRPEELPAQIAYAHLDGDLYESVRVSLEHVYPRLSPGGICVIDDYGLPALPGVAKAVYEFMQDKTETVINLNIPGVFDSSEQPVSPQGFFRKD